jgi:hypothetical protein
LGQVHLLFNFRKTVTFAQEIKIEMLQSHDYISGLQLYYYSMKKNIKNGTNSEDKVSESNMDEDTNIQNEGVTL